MQKLVPYLVALLAQTLWITMARAADETKPVSSAPDIVLAPVVVTGSRDDLAIEAPFSIDSVARRRIVEGQLGINASEALAGVPGLVVQNRQNYAQDLQISSRGFGARAAFGVRGIKLIADGIPASTPDGQGQAATFDLDVADRIEVIRGPAAAQYGSNAGGVIRYFSRNGEGPLRADAQSIAGSDGLRKNRVGLEGDIDGIGVLANMSVMNTDGYRDHSAAHREQDFAKISLAPDANSRLAVIYGSLQLNAQDPMGQTWQGHAADPRSVSPVAISYDTRKTIDHRQLGANYEWRSGESLLQLSAYAGTRHVVQYLSIPQGSVANTLGAGGVVDFDRDFQGLSARWIRYADVGAGTLSLVAGLDLDRSSDDRQGYQNYLGGVLGVKGSLRRDETDTATSVDPYLELGWTQGKWTLQAGLRRSIMRMQVADRFLSDGIDSSGEQRFARNTPTLNAMYAIDPDVRVYASAGKGFETPTQAEMAYAPGAVGAFNFGLQAATSRQYEAGIKTRLAREASLNAAIFRIDTDNEIIVAGSSNGRTSYRNAGRTLRRGVELSLDNRWSERWDSHLAVTRLDAVYASTFVNGADVIAQDNRLPGIPRTAIFGELRWTPIDGIATAIETQYRSKVFVEDTNAQNAAPGYATLNWRIAAEQKLARWTLREMFRIDNLFDRRYIGSVIVGDTNRRYYEAAPGRGWYAGVGGVYTF